MKAKPITPAPAIRVRPSGLWGGGEGVDTLGLNQPTLATGQAASPCWPRSGGDRRLPFDAESPDVEHG